MATASNEHELLAGLQIHPIGYAGATDPSTLPDWVGYVGFAWVDTSTAGSGYYTVKLWTGSAWISIGAAAISGAAGGDLTGTYPNPTIGANKVTTAKILNANVTLAKIANAAANSKLLGSGAAGSGSPYAEVTLGTNLSMTGTTLNAAGGGGGSGTVTSVATDATLTGGTITTTGTLGIAMGGVGTTQLAALAVTTAKLAAGAVTTAKIGSQFWSNEVAASDETTPITANPNALKFRQMGATTLNAGIAGIRASLSTASSVGIVTVDVLKNGVSILGTQITIDAGETTSVTAAAPVIIATPGIADNDEITIQIVGPGTSGDAAGLKVQFIGVQTA